MKRTKIDCLEDLEAAINKSAQMNTAKLVGRESGESLVPTYDWSGFLAPHFSKVVLIKVYHHFLFANSGTVTVKNISRILERKKTVLSDGQLLTKICFQNFTEK